MINNVKKLVLINIFTLVICLISCANTNSNHQNNSISLAENIIAVALRLFFHSE